MDTNEMLKRTKQFAIDFGHLILSLPINTINHAYSAQLIRSSSSVGANYRATRRAKSKSDFINKFIIVEEETDESLYFLELIVEFNKDKRKKIAVLYKEGEEILKIIVASLKTLQK
ncbi:MAG: four helix bundle protein [Thermoproteota archaeon]|nr:four helix bundle protein [Thermoproteota archaeon]